MKVKRLKDVKFEYDDSDHPTEIYITAHFEKTYLTKREFLALIKWGLKEGEWSSKELEPIYKQLKSVFINLKE